MTFDAVADGDDDTIFREIVLGSDVKEIWVEYSLRVPENFHHRTQSGPTNNKFFQVYRSPRGGSEAGVIAEHESPDGSGNSDMLRWTYQNPDRFNNWSNSLEVDNVEVDNVIAVSEQGTYHQWRWHVKVFSDSLTVNDNRAEDGWDGVLEIWKDGNLLFSRTDAPIGNPDASLNYMDTIRFLGWSNSGYDQQTRFSIDNVKIYTSDPGW